MSTFIGKDGRLKRAVRGPDGRVIVPAERRGSIVDSTPGQFVLEFPGMGFMTDAGQDRISVPADNVTIVRKPC